MSLVTSSPGPTGAALAGGNTSRRFHTPPTATVQYVSEFTLSEKNGDLANGFTIATRILLDWGNRKKVLPDFATRQERHGGSAHCPEVWAYHMQHREQTADYRRYWHTDVSLHRRQAHFDVRVSVSYALDYAFVGWAPKPPEASAPNFVLDWLGHANLDLRSGQFPIAFLSPVRAGKPSAVRDRIMAMTVTPAGADKLAKLIFDPQRALPVLVINGDINPVTFPLHPNVMQRLLLGACYIVWAQPMAGWAPAWREHFPRGFDCRPNTVRLYQPGVVKTSSYDSVRHRFFSDDEIHAHGGFQAFTSMIRDGLTRRLLAPRSGRIAHCEDVVAYRATHEFELQRSKLTSKDEELALYDSEYKRVLSENQTSDQLLHDTEAELNRVQSELASLRPHVDELTGQLESLKRSQESAPAAVDHSALLLSFFRNEARVADQLRAVSVLFPDDVFVLPTAIRSAEDAAQFEYPDEVRELLLKLVTDYRQRLIAGKGNQEACRVFGRNEFTTRESDNLSKRGREARTFSYNGVSLFMEQHLKIGVKDSEAHCLRLHFHWDAANQKIVIGHCGKHLPL